MEEPCIRVKNFKHNFIYGIKVAPREIRPYVATFLFFLGGFYDN